MTSTQTDRLRLPLLASGQAQKEIVHNEALLLLDLAAQAAVESAGLTAPPAVPAEGQCWIVASPATGDWAGMEGALAGWTASGWRFVRPLEGWCAWIMDRGNAMRFDGTDWHDEPMRSDGYYIDGGRVLATQQAAIADPGGGSTVDSEARATILGILAALRAHGLIAS